MDLRLGIFTVPDATDPEATIAEVLAADTAGLDFVGIQDAVEEAIAILRAFWSGERSVSFEGGHYTSARSRDGLAGDPAGWADQLARIADELRFTTLLVSPGDDDPVGTVRRLGEEVAPRVRELVG